ncbi:Doublesex- and mab-3-related transcription factor A2 [Tupaia chinensis]|uniref:Doublesex-and mab-3-related transcription factor A2 n=1 Tax=Tupaia chinensis TaxID=246437 RepID=L9KW80_TUPCH|nr:Doublesex- and mab-3-related transcription factor A2 [Tupaia chinensis]
MYEDVLGLGLGVCEDRTVRAHIKWRSQDEDMLGEFHEVRLSRKVPLGGKASRKDVAIQKGNKIRNLLPPLQSERVLRAMTSGQRRPAYEVFGSVCAADGGGPGTGAPAGTGGGTAGAGGTEAKLQKFDLFPKTLLQAGRSGSPQPPQGKPLSPDGADSGPGTSSPEVRPGSGSENGDGESFSGSPLARASKEAGGSCPGSAGPGGAEEDSPGSASPLGSESGSEADKEEAEVAPAPGLGGGPGSRQRTPLDILTRVFPGHRRGVLELVLQGCGRRTARALPALWVPNLVRRLTKKRRRAPSPSPPLKRSLLVEGQGLRKPLPPTSATQTGEGTGPGAQRALALSFGLPAPSAELRHDRMVGAGWGRGGGFLALLLPGRGPSWSKAHAEARRPRSLGAWQSSAQRRDWPRVPHPGSEARGSEPDCGLLVRRRWRGAESQSLGFWALPGRRERARRELR